MVQLSQNKSDPSIIYYTFHEDISEQDIDFINEMNTLFVSQYNTISIFININHTPIIDLNIISQAAKNLNKCRGTLKEAVIFNLVGFNLVFAYNMLNMLKPEIRTKFKIFSTRRECESKTSLSFKQDFSDWEEIEKLNQL